jgi:hypothetical protein
MAYFPAKLYLSEDEYEDKRDTYPDDIQHLISASIHRGLDLSDREIVDAWAAYSQLIMCAGWMRHEFNDVRNTQCMLEGMYCHAKEVGFRAIPGTEA